MKRKSIIKIMTLVFVFVFSAGITHAAIQGSSHDFSGLSWNSTGEICNVCHTPHNANLADVESPLWNHSVTTQTFTLYTSPTMSGLGLQPRPISKACLSCHDGTVALDSFGGNTGATFMGGDATVGTDLSDDHPVSIRWTHQNENPACASCHSIPQQVPFFGGYVECATCHDVHNGTGNAGMLRVTSDGDQICFFCHRK